MKRWRVIITILSFAVGMVAILSAFRRGFRHCAAAYRKKQVNYSINSAAVHAEEEGVVAGKWLNMV